MVIGEPPKLIHPGAPERAEIGRLTADNAQPQHPSEVDIALYGFSISLRSSLLGLKNGTLLAGTSTRAPVFGFRPNRDARSRVRKTAKPRISTLSSRRSAPTMLSSIRSTIAAASFCETSVTLATF